MHSEIDIVNLACLQFDITAAETNEHILHNYVDATNFPNNNNYVQESIRNAKTLSIDHSLLATINYYTYINAYITVKMNQLKYTSL